MLQIIPNKPMFLFFVLVAACRGDEGDIYKFLAEATAKFDAPERAAFELINKSPDPYGTHCPNAVAIVRAVNYLHSLGKNRAILILRKYQRYSKELGDAFEPEWPNQEKLCVIIPLLFLPTIEGDPVLSMDRNSKGNRTDTWNFRNMIWKDGLTFFKSTIDIRTTFPDRDYLVEWADQHGRLRDQPIRPTDDPLKTADEICEAIRTEDGRLDDGLKSRIRVQAWRTIRHLVPPANDSEKTPNLCDAAWLKLKEKARQLGIHWNETTQNYVTD